MNLRKRKGNGGLSRRCRAKKTNIWVKRARVSSLQKRLSSNPNVCIDYVPVCDHKIKFLSGSDRSFFEEKTVFTHDSDLNLPENYKEIHQFYIKKCFLPNIYVAAMKLYKPEFLHKTINSVGSRIWFEQKLATQGAHFSTISREIGLEFRESEFVVSHLDHRDPKKEIQRGSKALVDLGGNQAPLLSLNIDGEIVNMADFNEAYKYI